MTKIGLKTHLNTSRSVVITETGRLGGCLKTRNFTLCGEKILPLDSQSCFATLL